MTDMTDTMDTGEDTGKDLDAEVAEAIREELASQLDGVLYLPDCMSEERRQTHRDNACLMYLDMTRCVPDDTVHTMLACQMVAVHEAAMACFNRAAAADAAPPELRQRELRQGERLLSLFARQVEARDRHRERDDDYQDRGRRARRHGEEQAYWAIDLLRYLEKNGYGHTPGDEADDSATEGAEARADHAPAEGTAATDEAVQEETPPAGGDGDAAADAPEAQEDRPGKANGRAGRNGKADNGDAEEKPAKRRSYIVEGGI